MNPLVSFPNRNPYLRPSDGYDPAPVRAAVRSGSHVGTCHSCDRSAVIAAVHLVDEDDQPLCANCTADLHPGVAAGLRALNELELAVRKPGATPASRIVVEWAVAKQAGGRLGEPLLDAAAQLLARELRASGLELP